MPRSQNKEPKQKEYVSTSKRPIVTQEPDWYKKQNPSWSFKLLDHDWLPKQIDWETEIIKKLGDYEGQTWAEIMAAAGGRSNGTNSHFDNVTELKKFVQDRWSKLHLDEYDQVFSLRMTGVKRIFGILKGSVLYIIWYDTKHAFYDSNKKAKNR